MKTKLSVLLFGIIANTLITLSITLIVNKPSDSRIKSIIKQEVMSYCLNLPDGYETKSFGKNCYKPYDTNIDHPQTLNSFFEKLDYANFLNSSLDYIDVFDGLINKTLGDGDDKVIFWFGKPNDEQMKKFIKNLVEEQHYHRPNKIS